MKRLWESISWLNQQAGRMAALLLLPGMAITLYEVIARYVFDSPTIWVNESMQIIFGFYFLLGGGYTLLHGGHVRVDVLLLNMTSRGRRVANVFALLVVVFYASVLLWIGGEQAVDSMAAWERAESAWAPYIWPVVTAVPVAAALLLLQALALILRECVGLDISKVD